MRDLNAINSAATSTRFMFTICLIIPVFMGCGAWALAVGAAPKQELVDNYLGLIGLGIASAAIIALPIPYIFRWNWETRYFGAIIFPLSSVSIIGIYPILCIAQYSSPPILIRLTFVVLEFILIFKWCIRFVNIYRTIYFEKNLFHYIYTEESCAVYYSQQADKRVIGKLFNFEQIPHAKYFILSSLAAFSLIPFATWLSQIIGISFIHIFLAVFAIPLNMMFLGLTTRGWLIFYYYPMKIKGETHKPIYVDMSSHPRKLLTSRKSLRTTLQPKN